MSEASKSLDNQPRRVRIHSLPKVIFFYPVWLFSIVCVVVMNIAPDTTWCGPAWMALFTLNLFVIAYDFTEERTLIFLFGTIAVVLGLVLLGALSDVFDFLGGLKPAMNETFYLLMSVVFGVVFFISWVGSRLDYWELEPNEVIHRYGVFRRMKRFSTESLRWDKLVPDVMERIMLGTGTIILTSPYEKHPIVIDHVLRIGKIDEQIAHILGVKQVVYEKHPHGKRPEDETANH